MEFVAAFFIAFMEHAQPAPSKVFPFRRSLIVAF